MCVYMHMQFMPRYVVKSGFRISRQVWVLFELGFFNLLGNQTVNQVLGTVSPIHPNELGSCKPSCAAPIPCEVFPGSRVANGHP